MFDETVHIREYSIVAASHPCCMDGLAISLDWKFKETVRHIDDSQVRGEFYRPPIRLSYEERREMLMDVSGYSEEHLDELTQQVEEDEEYVGILGMIQRSWLEIVLPHFEPEDERNYGVRTETPPPVSLAYDEHSLVDDDEEEILDVVERGDLPSVIHWDETDRQRY